jgi:hypothetical protein
VTGWLSISTRVGTVMGETALVAWWVVMIPTAWIFANMTTVLAKNLIQVRRPGPLLPWNWRVIVWAPLWFVWETRELQRSPLYPHHTASETIPSPLDDTPGGTWMVRCCCGWERIGAYITDGQEPDALALADELGRSHETAPYRLLPMLGSAPYLLGEWSPDNGKRKK